tara:strand:- start:1443 stop:2426 length:984 start_codon:yes stop_codon:yes gene_type:complete
MKPKTPMMKALVGKQGNLPQHLQDKIKAAPESPAKSYGSKTKSPVMKTKNPYGDVVLDTSAKEVKRKKSKGKNIVTTETVEKGRSASRQAKLQKSLENKDFDEAGRQSTMAAREGAQRMGTKTYTKMKGTGGKGAMTGSTIAGTKTGPGGRTMKRTLKDGSKVVVEGSVSKIKAKGLTSAKPKARTLKGTASAIKPKKATAGKPSTKGTEELKKKKTSPVQKRGVKALEAQRGTKNASPIKKYGSKKSPVMQQKLKKKDTKGKTKLPKLVVNTPKGPKAPRGPQRGSIGGVNVSIQTKGRSTKNTDLLEVGKKYYKKAKKYVKSKMN